MLNELENYTLQTIKTHVGFYDAINQYELTQGYDATYGKKIDSRQVRDVIAGLIEQKYPIVSTPRGKGGYCWAGPDESLECYKRLRRQGLKVLLRARRTLKNSRTGQLSLDVRL